VTRARTMLRTYLAASIVKLEAHKSLTKDRRIRKKINQAIALKRARIESL